ncbi:MAG: 3'-5' exonuclease [Trichloromonas sp.]|jgi:DNA polymerase III epsilon subunit family exonuclease|nr:3'-5' exonuclease [Trichloromonas sp.]
MWKTLLKTVRPRRSGAERDPVAAYVRQRCDAIRSQSVLKKTLTEASYCIIDLETTGLNIAEDAIINAAGVKVKSGKITKIYEAYIKPPFPIRQESIQWHGITDDMLTDKPLIAETLPEFLGFIGNSIIVGHHINFDLRMLNRHLKDYYDCSLEGAPWLDTMLLHKLVMENNTNTQLDDLLSTYAVDCDQRHRALGDSIATTKVFLKISRELSSSYKTLNDLFCAQQDMSRKDHK